MTKKSIYRKAYAERAINISLACKKASNKMIATALGVSETSVRNWRREHPEFDKAITSARDIVREQVNSVIRGNLKPRRRTIVVNGGKNGPLTTVEEILPTHNDVLVFNKMGGRGSVYDEKTDDQRDILRRILNRKISGALSAIDAAQLLEAEGITVPQTLLLEVQKALGVHVPDPFAHLSDAEIDARLQLLESGAKGVTPDEPEPDPASAVTEQGTADRTDQAAGGTKTPPENLPL
jgi:hypothetical protein